MPTIQIEANVSRLDLLRAVQQLPPDELHAFVEDVLGLQAQRQAPCLSSRESELLLQINQGLPQPLVSRYRELIAKRSQENLSEDERRELLVLTEHVEELEAKRVSCLAELARLRRSTLADVMKSLGIQAPAHE